ncbi:MAG TPA: Na+/H+ antiporter NhaA [Gemmatimonadaceae bacterium]
MTHLETERQVSGDAQKSTAPDAPLIERILRPFQQFVATEAAGGIVLLVCAVAALIWANSPRGDAYFGLWERTFTVD